MTCCQTLIFGCITRKVLLQQTEAYLLYVRVGAGVPDEVRRQIATLQTLIFGCIARKMPFHKTEAYLSYVRVWEKVSDKARRQIAKFELVHFVVDLNARTHCCCNVH